MSPGVPDIMKLSMSVEPERLTAEFAYILFTDIVGYSLLPINRQIELTEKLQEVVESATEFSRAKTKGEVISRDTGDGLVLIFFHDLAAPVSCAIELARSLGTDSDIELRMGVHTGPIVRRKDIN